MSETLVVTSTTAEFAYNPLVLQYSEGISKWKLTLQLKPEPKIIFTGTDPTRDEIIECLRYHSSMPVAIIEMLEVIIGAEIARKAK